MTDQPNRRLRVSHVVVQPVLVWDDGENLSPGPETQAVPLSLADLPGFPDRLRAELAQAEAQAETPPDA